MTQTRREQALALAEELLEDIDRSRATPTEILGRTARLARLLDDTEAQEWLAHEQRGYSEKAGTLSEAECKAAARSGRATFNDKGGVAYWTVTIAQLQASIEASKQQLGVAADVPVSISTANPVQPLHLPQGNARERATLNKMITTQSAILGKIMGALHTYVNEREIELRFGAAVESAFTVVRSRVDARIAHLAPTAATKFAAAFENASSGNPEHWANAASECRRILRAIADELRPAGKPVNGRQMTDDKYINRLVDWIVTQNAIGGTTRDVVTSDLEDFGKRIDAFDDAGHKGAHAEVTQYEASRFITGAYLLIGDILDLWAEVQEAEANFGGSGEVTAEVVVGTPDSAVLVDEPTNEGEE